MDFEAPALDAHDAIVRRALDADRSALSRVRALARTIAEDPSCDHDIERLAERAAMSKRNLQRMFLRTTGVSPARFVALARIALAVRFLRETELPIKTVATRCGFGSEERMRRAFQRVLGANPRRCRGLGYPNPPWGASRSGSVFAAAPAAPASPIR